METTRQDARYVPFVALPLRALYVVTGVLAVTMLAAAAVVALSIHTRPLLAIETPEPAQACPIPAPRHSGHVEGPFRPRPPEPSPVPDPPQDDLDQRERRLLARLKEWVDLRADLAQNRAVRQMQDDLLDALERDPQKVEGGTFAAIFAARLSEFVVKVVKVMLAAAVLAVLIGLLWTYWPWIAGTVVVLLAALRLWIGSIVARAKR